MKPKKFMTLMTGAAVMAMAAYSLAGDAGVVPPTAQAKKSAVFQKADADGDGNISAAEFQARWDAWFKEVDANGDNKLTADEFAKSRQADFKNMDTNGDGAIVVEEYAVFFCGPQAQLDKEAKTSKTDKATLYETIDANDDGFLTVSECLVYRIVIFRQLDANGDGKVTPEEFAVGADKHFAAMDLNQDNTIAKDEFDLKGVNKARGTRAPETNLPVAN